MSDFHPSDDQLRADLARLTARVYALEQTIERLTGQRAAEPVAPMPAAPQPAIRPYVPAAAASTPYPVTPPPPPPMAAPPRRPAPPPRPPINWGKLAEQLFTARTLAWAGGVATALGIVLLFVLAASRGWVTPPMRLGVGVFVSLVMLIAAIDLDRRKWRADAILAAAGVGIAGLYTTLWAAASLYDYVSAAPASALAALIAAAAVAVAIRLRQEPLAVFGVSGAMLAPVLVSHDVTAYGVLYAALMLAATMPLYVRFRWQWLVSAAWMIGAAETVALVVAERHHTGFGAPVVATAVVTLLFVCLLFLVELLPDTRARISPLGWLIASSAFTLALGGVFLFADTRHAAGHSLAGFALLGVMMAWAIAAAVPYLLRRPHADLSDVLAAFSLTLAATATGLLAGGAALPCTWAAQSAMLIGAAERIARRSQTRQRRITIAAGVYLALATISTVRIVLPTDAHLPHLGAGSWQGSVALIAVALAGIVYCYGARWIAHAARVADWALPALALAYLPLWSLTAGWAAVALAAMTAALFGYRRSRLLVSWLSDEAAIVIATGWWLVGAAVVLKVAAPLRELSAADWVGVGRHHGLLPLAALTAAAGVAVWSLRRPRRNEVEYLLLFPVATFAYLIAEALRPPYAMWAWLSLAGLLAAVVHVPMLRRRLLAWPLVASSAASLALGLIAAWGYDQSLEAVIHHGTTRGWPSILIGCAAAALLASSLLDPRQRSYALWLPYLLLAQLAAMLLPGQYPVVAAAGLAASASALAVVWPGPVRRRLARAVIVEIGVIAACAVAAVVLVHYETPKMLFVSSHVPASGLAAALAGTIALFAAAAAARARSAHVRWAVGKVKVATGIVYLAGAASLWTLAAAILGGEQLVAQAGVTSSVHDHFQQGQVAVSISWVLVGLALVVVSLGGDRRAIRVGGIALLFVALGKLFLYDLAFLSAMARAVSFIATGSVLLVAALLLQRFAPQVKAALGEDQPPGVTG